MISLIQHPSRKRALILAAALSLIVHLVGVIVVRTAPIFSLAMQMRQLEFVEEDFNRAILIDFSQRLRYPPGYLGFRPPEKTLSLEEMKKEQERRARREAARQARLKREAEARRRAAEAEAARLAEEQEKTRAEQAAQDLAQSAAKPDSTPKPTPHPDGYGRFGKINTAPIKEQVQRLYEAKKAGKLTLPEGQLRVGIEGSIAEDGTIARYRISVPSGIPEIDEAAKAILDAVSASRALGVLHTLTSLSMVLEIDQRAELRVVGFTDTEAEAKEIVDLAQAALLLARFKKSGDAAAMVMLNNLRVTRAGARIQATISVPRQMASDTLANTMEKGKS